MLLNNREKSRFSGINLWFRFLIWFEATFNPTQRLNMVAFIVGLASGFSAVVLKNMVHVTAFGLNKIGNLLDLNYLYFIYPIVGIWLAIVFLKYVVKRQAGHGVPGILLSISQKKGAIEKHHMYSSLVASTLTVGFGGSVGLEGPIVGTGAAIGSNVGQAFRLKFRQIRIIIGCASSAAVASIFNAPIAGIIFSFEILMLDLTMSSIVPLLIASISAILTSYFFIGNDILYPYQVVTTFTAQELPFYLLLGVFCGMFSYYFATVYTKMHEKFQGKSTLKRLFMAGGILGILIFLFPPLYGEGYAEVNHCLAGELNFIFYRSIFDPLRGYQEITILLLLLIILFKAFATSATFEAGGVGGIFAPSLFMGAHAGTFVAMLINYTEVAKLSTTNFALIGMAGMMSGILYAPLFSIFLIAEISGGYGLLVPIMITSLVSFIVVKYFAPNSVYTRQLAEQRMLLTHNKDKSALTLMRIDSIIETDFLIISSTATLGDLAKLVTQSKRNVFPVIDSGVFKGVVFINDIRHILLRDDLYDKVKVSDLMYMPTPIVLPRESMDEVVRKFKMSNHYNLPVVENGKYYGFVSRANTFSYYQKIMRDISEE